MEFPYHDVEAWLGVGCDGDSEWAYVGFTEAPNLVKDQTKDGYNAVDTRVRWYESVESMSFIQEWSEKALHFRDDQQATSRMAGASSMLLELNWYGQSRVHFEFTLRGSPKALAAIRDLCPKY